MIAPVVIAHIRRLIAANDLSQRRIAEATGVSRGTVAAVAAGKRPDHGNRPPAESPEPALPHGPPQRCPECGGRVYAPCRLCSARATIARSSPPAIRTGSGTLDLQLRDEHRTRYEQLRAARTAAVNGSVEKLVSDSPHAAD
jgi:hypothetical protein